MKKENVLIVWLIITFLLDIFLLGGVSYLIVWKGISIWWLGVALILGLQPSLYKALSNYFNIEDEQ